MTTREHNYPFALFLSTFVHEAPETNTTPVVREIKQLPGDLGIHPADSDGVRLELDWMLLQDCWRLVAANPGHQRLRLERVPAFQEREASRKFIHGVLATLKDLRELSMPNLMDSVDFWSLDKLAPMVVSLVVYGVSAEWMSDNDPQLTPLILSPEKTIRRLKTLILATMGHVEPASVLLFLKRLPDLESLSLSLHCHLAGDVASVIGTSLAQTPPVIGLKRLYFTGTTDRPTSILPHLPNLTELNIHGMTTEIAAVLIMHCKKIEVVSQIHDPWFIGDVDAGRPPSDGIHKLLVHLPALKSLNMIASYIHVDDLVQWPWACMGIEKLRCRIVGLERLNEPREEIYNKISAPGYTTDLTMEELAVLDQFQRCRRQQGQVYDRLASLTKSKVLDVGFEWRYPWTYKGGSGYEVDGKDYLRYEGPIPDTMEFSLESGLDRLSALKNLEMFGFEGNNHKIGEKELDWMVEKWPKLNLMYGLAEDKLYMIEYDQKKAALRDCIQHLKPEVVHDSLFEDNV